MNSDTPAYAERSRAGCADPRTPAFGPLRLGVVAVCAGLLACAGCVGIPSKAAAVRLSDQAPLSEPPSGEGAWPAEDWWRQYGDPTLDTLVDMALDSSPTLATAHARFESARQSVRIASAASGAHVEASGDFSRQRLSDNGLFSPSLLGFHWYDQADLGLQASYTFDWWGKQRQAVESAMDLAHASRAEHSAAARASARLPSSSSVTSSRRASVPSSIPAISCNAPTRPSPRCASRSPCSRARRLCAS